MKVTIKDIVDYLTQVKHQVYYPLPVIQVGDEFILGDGHHSCSALHLLTEQVDIVVLETDREVRDFKRGGHFVGYGSLKEAIEDLTRLAERAMDFDISQIQDMYAYDGEGNPPEQRRVRDLDITMLLQGVAA